MRDDAELFVAGDDQDLDDRVIQQLWDENQELKDQLEVLRTQQTESAERRVEEGRNKPTVNYVLTSSLSHPFFLAELSAILRDRINDLLVANADLEKEVSRLRYSNQAVSKTDLDEAKSVLNDVANENDQLKLAVARARYATPPPVEVVLLPPPSADDDASVITVEKEHINTLISENEELKSEVRDTCVLRELGEKLQYVSFCRRSAKSGTLPFMRLLLRRRQQWR